MSLSFQLNQNYLNTYSNRVPQFGFDGVGQLTYLRTYSRKKENGEKEQWNETVERVVNGLYSIQKEHILAHNLGWNEEKGQISANEMMERIFDFKFLPPGRGLWAMGTDIITKKKLASALYNCAFVSTENIDTELTRPFDFLMDQSCLGVGVAFDVLGAGKIIIKEPGPEFTFVVPDSREGWVESNRLLLLSYFTGSGKPDFDYSNIRPAGVPLKTFGGTSSGPTPLVTLHIDIRKVLDRRINQPISITDIADIMNLDGRAVVSGGILFNLSFLNLKNELLNKKLI